MLSCAAMFKYNALGHEYIIAPCIKGSNICGDLNLQVHFSLNYMHLGAFLGHTGLGVRVAFFNNKKSGE
jgi:hypothetical protein